VLGGRPSAESAATLPHSGVAPNARKRARTKLRNMERKLEPSWMRPMNARSAGNKLGNSKILLRPGASAMD
jgi:hypothetical protein